MKEDVILLPGNEGEGLVAAALVNDVKEAIVFLMARLGFKSENMMIVDPNTWQLLAGEEVYREKLARGDTHAEVVLCDPDSPAVQRLAEINRSNLVNCHRIQKEYCYVDPNELARDKEHAEHFGYDSSEEFEGTIESYAKYDRMKPVYFVEFFDGDKLIKAVVDGEKYVQYARREKMEKVFACRLVVANNDDLLTIMFQLQRSNHESCMALFRMIQALWPKYFKGSGYRSDINDDELDSATGPDGKKLNLYSKVGLELNLTGNRVKQIRKIGLVNPLHFERIEQGRYTFFQAYQACVKEERQELAPVPSLKAPTFHTSSTPVPQFTKPDTTAGNADVKYSEYEEVENGSEGGTESTFENHDDIPVGKVVAVTDDYIIVQGGCFLFEIFVSHPQVMPVLAGLWPKTEIVMNPSMLYIAIGILGATVMPHTLYLHSSIVQTRNYPRTTEGKKMAIRFGTIDSTLALMVAFFINAAILVVAAATFHTTGHEDIADIMDAHKLLSPLLGTTVASTLFAVALLASGQNSTLTGTLAGQIVMEGFLNIRLNPWLRRLITRLIAIIPAFIVTWIYGEKGTSSLLILSQVILSMQLSFAVIPLVMFTNDKRKMGQFANSRMLSIAVWLIAAVVLGLNIYLLKDMLF